MDTEVDLFIESCKIEKTACVTNSEQRMEGSVVVEEYNIGVPLNCYDYCKCYSSFKKSALTCSANFASSKIRHPTIAIPAAQLIARLYDSIDPAPAVNCGVWLTPSAGMAKMPWKPGTTYDTFPKHCQLSHWRAGFEEYEHIPISVEPPPKPSRGGVVKTACWPIARKADT